MKNLAIWDKIFYMEHFCKHLKDRIWICWHSCFAQYITKTLRRGHVHFLYTKLIYIIIKRYAQWLWDIKTWTNFPVLFDSNQRIYLEISKSPQSKGPEENFFFTQTPMVSVTSWPCFAVDGTFLQKIGGRCLDWNAGAPDVRYEMHFFALKIWWNVRLSFTSIGVVADFRKGFFGNVCQKDAGGEAL